MQDFTKLLVWQKSHNLTINIYKLTSQMPSEEKFGLISQIRRSSVSIESTLVSRFMSVKPPTALTRNLAEGCPKGYRFPKQRLKPHVLASRRAYGRDGDKELARFVDIAMGSSFELRCQLLISRDLGYIEQKQYELFESKIIEVNKMLGGLLKKLRA